MPKITFLSTDSSAEISVGTELLDLYKTNPWLPLKFSCTKGDCGVCVIKIRQGMENLTKATKEELRTKTKKGLDEHCRLACQCALMGDVEVE